MKKIAIMWVLSLMAVAAVQADMTFSDDFTRDNTANPDGGLGADWTTTSGIFLNSNVAKTQTSGRQLAIYNGDVTLTNDFSISLDMYAQANDRYVGLVFNYSDADNFYILRTKFNSTGAVWQALKVEGGTQSLVDSGNIAAGSMTINTWRTLSLSGTTDGVFNFAVTDVSGDNTYASDSFSDTSLNGGTSGFVFDSNFVWADNYELSVVPEPVALGMIGLGGCLVLFVRRIFII